MSGSDYMGRPKKEKPNHASGMYEVKITIGHTFDGKPIRKSFYSSVSKSTAKAKDEQFKIDQAVSMQTDTPFVSKKECFDTWAIKWLETYKLNKVKEHTKDPNQTKQKHARGTNSPPKLSNYLQLTSNGKGSAHLIYGCCQFYFMVTTF